MSVINYHDPIAIGDGDDFGAYISLSTLASHSMGSNDNLVGVSFADGWYPSGEGSNMNATGVSIYSNIDEGTLDSFISLSIQHNIAEMPTNLYGLKIETAVEGTGGNLQYGIFIDNQNIASTCYSIWTEAGDIRFGSLAGVGNRTVHVRPDGTLYA